MAVNSILWYLRSLAAAQEGGQTSDSELLERFCLRQDQAAFEVLLARHGPMVWGVCRSLLVDMHVAEDAFQATFLVLVRKARSIGRRELLANWLYGVAYRVAVRARSQGSRRQAREAPLPDDVKTAAATGNASFEERQIVHEELNRLPARYRTPLILCYLQGKSREEAAREVGCSPGSMRGRLERGREKLRERLTRRGLALSAGTLSLWLDNAHANVAVPATLLATTMRVAWLSATGAGTVSVSVSVTALIEGATQAMFLHKVKLTAAAVLGLGVFAVGTNTLMHAQVKTNDTRTQRVASELPPDEAKLREEKLNQFLAGKLPGDEFFLPTLSEAEYNALFAQFKGTDKMKSLLKEQLDAAQVENNTRYKEFLAGRGTLSTYIGASVRLLSVELMLSTKQDDLVNALETQLQRMKIIVHCNQVRFDEGRIPIMDLAQSKYHRAQAEIWLERAKAGEKLIPAGWWDGVTR